MSAVPQSSVPLTSPSSPSGNASSAGHFSNWLPIHVAAERAGISIGAMRNRQKDYPRHLVKLAPPPSGRGCDITWIHQDADPRLARVKSPEHLPCDLTAYTSAQRDELLMREKILADWEQARTGGVTLGFNEAKITAQFLIQLEIERGLKINRKTLFNWRAAYRAQGRAGLIDGRWKQRDAAGATDEFADFRDYQQRMYLTTRRLSKTLCYELSLAKAQELGWQFPGTKTARRWLEALPPQLVVKMREGNDAFVARCEPAIERDFSTLASNELWCGDDHNFDVMVIDPNDSTKFVRPWISGWEDIRSRKIVGFTIQAASPATDTMLRAFCRGLKTHGRPAGVMVDNGKTYDSRAAQGVSKKERRQLIRAKRYDATQLGGAFGALQVSVRHVEKYHGQSKPIERAFGTICARFSKTWDTYCGKDVLSKPEDLQAHLEAGHAPTMAEFVAAFEAFVENDYHQRGHVGDAMNGQRPAEVFEANLPESGKDIVADEIAEFICMAPVGPVKVGKHGVCWNQMNYGAFDASVQKLFGQKVMLKFGDGTGDVGRVHLADLGGRYLCTARLNKKLPFLASQEDLKSAIAEKKQLRKTLANYVEKRPRIGLDTQALLARNTVEKAVKIAAADAPLKAHRTPLDDQFIDIQKAVNPQRVAVSEKALRDELDDLRPTGTFPRAVDSDPSADEDLDTFGAISAAMAKTKVQRRASL
jgi:hypothetical protein